MQSLCLQYFKILNYPKTEKQNSKSKSKIKMGFIKKISKEKFVLAKKNQLILI